LFKTILDKNPDSDRVLFYLGSLYEETQRTDLAVDALKRIKAGSKLYGEAVLHVGFLLKQDKKIDQAKDYMKQSIKATPDVANFYVFQASLEEETKNIGKAVKILENAEKKFPDDEKILYYLGSLYDRQGKQDKGLEKMEALLKLSPDNVDALNYIGYTWTQMGIRLDDAEKLLRKALALRPDNGYIQDSWGWYLFVRGRTSEAVVELEKAAKLKPNESTILEHLGDAYLRSNLEEKALVQYKNAAIYAEDDDSRKKLGSKADNLKQELAKEGRISLDRMPAGTGH
jgi:tetratricopeptide (TPR) repeat protein